MYNTKFSPQFSKWNVKIILFLGIFAILALILHVIMYYTINIHTNSRMMLNVYGSFPCLTIQKPSSISFQEPYIAILCVHHMYILFYIYYISYLDSHKNFGVSICIYVSMFWNGWIKATRNQTVKTVCLHIHMNGKSSFII